MTALMITVGGASLVAYVIKRASANRDGRRRGPAGDGASNSTNDSGGDSEGFGWFSNSGSDHSDNCSADSSSIDAGGGGDCGGGGDSGGGGSGD